MPPFYRTPRERNRAPSPPPGSRWPEAPAEEPCPRCTQRRSEMLGTLGTLDNAPSEVTVCPYWEERGASVRQIPHVDEHPRRGRGVRQRLTGSVAVLRLRERPVGRHKHPHVVVGVISPPGTHPERRLQAQCLPRPPQRIETAARLRVAPPVPRPTVGALRADATGVGVAQFLPHELVAGSEEELRFRR